MFDFILLGQYANENKQYLVDAVKDVYSISRSDTNTKLSTFLPSLDKAEDMEAQTPSIAHMMNGLAEDVMLVVTPSEIECASALRILEQLKGGGKTAQVMLLNLPIASMNTYEKMLHRVHFHVLQEYARSGMVESATLFDISMVDKKLNNVPLRQYSYRLSEMLYWPILKTKYLQNIKPDIGYHKVPDPLSRIISYSLIDVQTMSRDDFHDIDICNRVEYYFYLSNDIVDNGKDLKGKINSIINSITGEFTTVSYAVYSHEDAREIDVVFCRKMSRGVQYVLDTAI